MRSRMRPDAGRRRRHGHVHDGFQHRGRHRARRRHRRVEVLLQDPPRRRRGLRHVQQAAIAVATGVADCVVAYRAFNERSGQRFGQVQLRLIESADSTSVDNSFSYPHGLSTPAAQVAMIAKRYMHLSGATSRDFGAMSVADRKHAANNPEGVLLREADHHRGSPEFAVDRRAAAAAGLLSGDRRRGGDRGDVRGAGQDLKHRPRSSRRPRRGRVPISTRW